MAAIGVVFVRHQEQDQESERHPTIPPGASAPTPSSLLRGVNGQSRVQRHAHLTAYLRNRNERMAELSLRSDYEFTTVF